MAGRQAAGAGDPRPTDRGALRELNDPTLVRAEYADESRFAVAETATR